MAMFHHTLGLWYVRAKMPQEAEQSLKKATELDKSNGRFAYVYAVSVGEKNPQEAIQILEKAYAMHQGDIGIISALAYYYKVMGNAEKSAAYEKKAKALQNFSVR